MSEKRWDLSPIYPSVDSKEFNADLEKLKGLLAAFKVELESAKPSLAKLIEMENEIEDISETLGSYAYCNVSVNTTDKAAVNALNKVDELSMDMAVCDTMFTEFVASNKAAVDEYCKENPDYRFVLNEITEQAKHQMPKEMEELAADLMRSGSDAFGRLQETIS
jgi:oligoendopeptidase F